MKRWLGLLGICLAGLMLLSCSSGQQLQSITVTPQSATFLDPDATRNCSTHRNRQLYAIRRRRRT